MIQFTHLGLRLSALSIKLRPKWSLGCSTKRCPLKRSFASRRHMASVTPEGVSGTVNRRAGTVIAFAMAALVGACEQLDPQWKGWVYPDRTDTTVDWKLGTFATLKECREAAQSMIDWLPDPTAADYECGYKCAPSEFMSRLDVCAETRR